MSREHSHHIVQRDAWMSQALAEADLLFATISAALIGIDTNDRVTRWNTAAERMFGVSAEKAKGKKLGELGIDLDWAEIFIGMGECLLSGKSIEKHDLRYNNADGREGFMTMHIASSWSATGDGSENLGVVLLAFDTTDYKLSESQRGQSQKLESIGQLAAGIAHEINTPIQFIGDNLRFLKDSFDDLQAILVALQDNTTIPNDLREQIVKLDMPYLIDEIPKAISQSLEGTDHVAQIVKAMKEFSHPDSGELKQHDINHALQTSIIVSRNEFKYVAELEMNLDTSLPHVPCLPSELNQVFVNLIVNAAHAIKDVVKDSNTLGKITISTKLNGDYAEIRIGDSGTGIPEKIRNRLFEPFFTTKGVGKGTGQGLYLAHAIITKKHGGTIHFETEIGKGTTFVIRLPVVVRVKT
jgi:PAS domain S-box-containing protein